ncbi:unnamed protein product [Didymodactylos carnosus]|uniref:Uncharacterized protein n=1 Tax=Didymodactylos carnosus TaxID=1234261 RepID=A0A815B7X9_9BILA|nr:unnamed protein product [Didymodactylos carnosus]CAF1267580.1 unnamed protein product [Didymodactylos carnosus]CAF3846975.1 unnamed protein product [Didymodactylos carnosus]CAF4052236.1 unnamed protein product [Didymodactylos carnosus]
MYIENAHRIRVKNVNKFKHETKTRPAVLIARFYSCCTCRELLNAKYLLYDMAETHPYSQVLITEDHSRHNEFLFFYARAKLPRNERHHIYSKNGRVYYYVEHNQRILLTKSADLDVILAEHPKQNVFSGDGAELV